MKKVFFYTIVALFLLMLSIGSTVAVTVEGGKGDAFIKIKTDTYEVHWKTGAQMGYMVALVKGKALFDDKIGRRLYHSGNYAGWKDWGALTGFKVLENKPGIAKVEFVSDDGGSKEWHCVVTFWDGTPLIKHEVTVKAKKTVVSFSHGHEPMYEVAIPAKDQANWESKGDKGPFAHNAFWIGGNFSALYATHPKATAREFPAWQAAGKGRMDLVHNDLAKEVKEGKSSDPLVYFVAFGPGGKAEAHALADEVAKGGPQNLTTVDSNGKLSITWGTIKDIR
jgi:hypothetical protein